MLRRLAVASLVLILGAPSSTEAQLSTLAPSRWSIGTGIGSRLNDALIQGSSSAGGRALAFSARTSWRLAAWTNVEAELVSVGGSGWQWNPRAATSSCLPSEPCLRREAIGTPLVGAALRGVIEPRRIDALSGPRLSAGVGHLLGKGVSYYVLGFGMRFGAPSSNNLVIDFERWYFDAPTRVFDVRRPELGQIDTEFNHVHPTLIRVSLSAPIG